jgi:hypothetical protein
MASDLVNAQDSVMPDVPPREPAQPPTILYKYYAPERVHILEDLMVKFTCPIDFNDYFDCYGITVYANGVQQGLTQKQLGIFCLTEKPDDQVMWVHYAKTHTGFVIGFDTNDAIFTGPDIRLDKVTYQYREPFPLSRDGCFYKGEEWEHEREWRCVRTYKDQDECRLVPISKSAMREIIIGKKMESQDRLRLLRSIKSKDGGFSVSLKVTSFDQARKQLFIQPFSGTLCNVCHGYGIRYD